MQFTGDEQAARESLERVRAIGAVSVFNVPESDPLVGELKELGGHIALRQREMLFTVS